MKKESEKMKSKKLLSIIVTAILALSFMLPLVSVTAISAPIVTPAGDKQVGDVLTVTGIPGDVTSGATVEVYWDIVMGPDAMLLNTTTGDPDGSYDVEITVPDSVNGSHYVWVKDTATGETASSIGFAVVRKVELDPERGLKDDEVDVTGTGFSAESEITLWFVLAAPATAADELSTRPSTVETDEWGTFTCEFDVPDLAYATYTVIATDDIDDQNETAAFIIGPSLTLDIEEGPTGTVVEIKGRGFEPSRTLVRGNFTWEPFGVLPRMYPMYVTDDDGEVDVDSNGKFTGHLVIPVDAKGEYEIEVDDNTWTSIINFTIDGRPETEVDPSYGAPGATITVSGGNFTQISGLDVIVTLDTVPETTLVTATTNADGTWEDTFTAPAVTFANYKVNASDEYDIWDDTGFKVGLIAMIINPVSGPSGTEVSLTGIGFADGDYNMSFGDEDQYLEGNVVGEAISDTFFVPTTDPGVYDVSVTDSNENVLTSQFTVTATTSLTPTPAEAAIGFNMSIYGEYFGEDAGADVDWYIYNSTEVLDITGTVNETIGVDVTVSSDGNFTGYWMVPDWCILGNSYIVNATDDNDLWGEFNFTVVPEAIEIRPNSGVYSLGETITFTMKATFKKVGAVLEIRDPADELYFKTEFEASDWSKVDAWQVVRISYQLDDASLYPYIIPTDAAIGTWNWTMYEDDTSDAEIIETGLIEVIPTTAEQVNDRLSSVEDGLASLGDDINTVNADLSDKIDSVTDEINDVQGDIAGVKTDVASVKGDVASAKAAADAAKASADSALDAISDVADTADDAKTAADSAKTAADAAKSSADDAKTAASGLTTLVYGAIGASLIAALAAIVSLMQISRRIAG
jgi:hypothetical protein